MGEEDLATICPKIQPRYYSISSSSLALPTQIDLTVALHTFTTPAGVERRGLASTFLVDQARPGGATVPGFVQESTFRLPEAPETPVIMIAAGSGIAPFRGFVQERDLLRRSGVRVGHTRLYFGSCSPDTNDLYKLFFETVAALGSLDLRKTYDNWPEGAPREYPQDRVRKDSDTILGMMRSEGAHLYVCGHGKLGTGVREALLDSLGREVSGVSPGNEGEQRKHMMASKVAAEEVLEQWKAEGRYSEDIFL
ncbi:unnamed protein product [Discosporangium mesarthrocarpum]